MRLPGTLPQLWKQLKASPTPIRRVSIPTEHGPLEIEFTGEEGPLAAAATVAKAAKAAAAARPPKPPSDIDGVFQAPPQFRDDPFGKRTD